MTKYYLLIFMILACVQLHAQTERKYIREGNSFYNDKKFAKAEVSYQKALNEKETSADAAYNLATAFFKQEKYDKAEQQFTELAKAETNKVRLGNIYHNLGNAQIEQSTSILKEGKIDDAMKKVQESIDSYKNALRNNPDDKETKYNLLYAQKLLQHLQQQKQQQQNQEQNQDQKQENKDKENQKGDQKKDTDGDGIPDETEKQGQNQSAKNPDTDKDGASDYNDPDSDNDGLPDSHEAGENPERPKDTDNDGTPDYRDLDSNNDGKPDSEDAKQLFKISKEDALRILEAIQNDDKNVQEKVKKANAAQKMQKEKNW